MIKEGLYLYLVIRTMIQVGPDYLNSLIANLMIEDSTTDTSPKIEGLTIKSPFNWLQEKKIKSKLTHTYIFLETINIHNESKSIFDSHLNM